MGVFELLVYIGLIGLVAFGMVKYLPMSDGVARVVEIVAIVVVVWMVLSAFGLLPRDFPVPKLG